MKGTKFLQLSLLINVDYSLPIPLNSKVTYVLQLEHSCWYVGVSKNGSLNKRLSKHFSHGASGWTIIHKPIKVSFVVKSDHEERLTRSLIAQYGTDKVRGWNYVKVHNPSFEPLACTPDGCISPVEPHIDVVSLFSDV